MKKGIVLEGGGLRGAYTAGALSWLIDHKIFFDYGVAMSISILYLLAYFTNNKELMKEVCIEVAGKPDVGLKAILKEGQVVAYDKMIQQVLDSKYALDYEAARNVEIKLETGLFNLDTGTMEWVTNKEVTNDLAKHKAAIILPFFGHPIKFEGKHYLDGGITTMIPIHHALEENCDKYFIITTKSKDYIRKPYAKPIMAAFKVFYGKYPNLYDYINNRVKIYENEKETVQQLIEENKAIHLFPSEESGVGRFSGTREQLEKLFHIGYNDMEQNKEKILEFLEEE